MGQKVVAYSDAISTMLNLLSSFTDDNMIPKPITVHDDFIIILSQYIAFLKTYTIRYTKGDSFIYLAEVSDAETLDLLRGLFHYNLVEELIIYLFPYSAGKGNSIQAIFPVRQWQLHKTVVLPGGICRLIYRNPCRM